MTRWLVASVLGAVVVALAASRLYDAGVFNDVRPQNDETCTLISGDAQFLGLEDIALVESGQWAGLAFVASDDRHAINGDNGMLPPLFNPGNVTLNMLRSQAKVGGLYVVDLNDGAKAVPRRLSIAGYPYPHFHPHGVTHFHPDGDTSTVDLVIVNHLPTFDELSVFRVDFEIGAAVYQHGLRHPLMRPMTANNVVMTADGRHTYVTNWIYDPPGTLGFWLEAIARAVSWGTVLRCSAYTDADAFQCDVQDSGVAMPNGVALSRDERQVYVASCATVRVYDRADDGALELARAVPLDNVAVADNLWRDTDGNILTGSHANVLQFVKHAKHPRHVTAPSQVVRVSHDLLQGTAQPDARSTQTLMHAGNLLSGSSIAVTYNGAVVVGGVFSPGLLVCSAQ